MAALPHASTTCREAAPASRHVRGRETEQMGQTPASCGVGSPFCPRLAPAPQEKHSPPLPNPRSGASACQTSASGFHLQRERERWERVEKPRGHFLVRPGRQSSSVPPRPMGGCESPPAIAGRCSPHPGRLAAFLPGAQLILLSPGTGYCLADCRTSALLKAARRRKMVP